MALKKKITKEKFEKLSDELKKEYKEKDGDYILDLEGEEDTGALKRAKDREKERADEAEAKVKELTKKLESDIDLDARKKGDIETLEKSWAKKVEEAEKTANEKINKLAANLKSTLIDNESGKLAGEISKAPKIMQKLIKERLAVDLDGENPVVKILDASGKPSALTLDELKKEFVDNKDYADIIIASKASGSGTSTQQKPIIGSAENKPVILANMKGAELVAYLKQKKEEGL